MIGCLTWIAWLAGAVRSLQKEIFDLEKLCLSARAEVFWTLPWPSSTMVNETVKDTLEEAEALERHVKTVTMRMESLATTDADFVKTLVSRQEDAHLNALSHLSTVAPGSRHNDCDVLASEAERRGLELPTRRHDTASRSGSERDFRRRHNEARLT